MMDAATQLSQGVAALGLSLDQDSQDRLMDYLHLMQRWNQAYNLTAVTDLQDMVVRHLLDSLAIWPHVPEQGVVVDAGAGAGLPGMVLAIARPQQPFVMVDSNGKKVRFLNQVRRHFGLDQVRVVQARIEALQSTEPNHQSNLSEPAPAVVLARALASLDQLVAWCAPWLAAGTTLLAMKGALSTTERAAVPPAYNVDLHPLQVPGLDAQRCVVGVTRKP
jgi:16S rRNA (guanine527-N7)-methyltransferase